jgi:hypothetical protein
MTYRVFPCMAAAAVAGWAAILAPFAYAQSPADFYKGKNVDLYIGYSVGGGYDLYARVLARHIGQHIPGNPTIVVKNMEGAGSLRLANWLYRVAPKDGSVFAIIGRGMASSRCWASRRRSSTAPSSPGSAAATTRSASASLMATARASRNSPISRPRR